MWPQSMLWTLLAQTAKGTVGRVWQAVMFCPSTETTGGIVDRHHSCLTWTLQHASCHSNILSVLLMVLTFQAQGPCNSSHEPLMMETAIVQNAG